MWPELAHLPSLVFFTLWTSEPNRAGHTAWLCCPLCRCDCGRVAPGASFLTCEEEPHGCPPPGCCRFRDRVLSCLPVSSLRLQAGPLVLGMGEWFTRSQSQLSDRTGTGSHFGCHWILPTIPGNICVHLFLCVQFSVRNKSYWFIFFSLLSYWELVLIETAVH